MTVKRALTRGQGGRRGKDEGGEDEGGEDEGCEDEH
jgi:hypothetical protein